MNEQVRTQIETAVKSNKVVLFMKGNRSFPQCGFSATVIGILNQLVPKYETINVLENPAIRDGIKEYSEWPTIPQLYIDGEFVGGCDIVKSLHASGELNKLLGVSVKVVAPPKISLSPSAAKAFRDAGGEGVLRMEANERFQYDLYFSEKRATDLVVVSEGLSLHVDPQSAGRLDGAAIDFIESPDGGGFKISNPNEPPRVKQLAPRALKSMLDAGEKFELFDVRTPEEQNTATLNGRLLDEAGRDYLLALDKNTLLVFHCHHGGRSQQAASYFLAQGFKNVYNLEGGIDAWSQSVDPTVRRY